jgi:hypothetical protein
MHFEWKKLDQKSDIRPEADHLLELGMKLLAERAFGVGENGDLRAGIPAAEQECVFKRYSGDIDTVELCRAPLSDVFSIRYADDVSRDDEGFGKIDIDGKALAVFFDFNRPHSGHFGEFDIKNLIDPPLLEEIGCFFLRQVVAIITTAGAASLGGHGLNGDGKDQDEQNKQGRLQRNFPFMGVKAP